LAFHPKNEQILFAGLDNGIAQVIDITGKPSIREGIVCQPITPIDSLDGEKKSEMPNTKKNPIKGFAFHPANSTMLCICEDELTLWDASDYHRVTILSGIDSVGLWDVCFTHDGLYIVALLKISRIAVWNIESMMLVSDTTLPEEFLNGPPQVISISSDDRYLATICP
jgi:WD40 repeat protein